MAKQEIDYLKTRFETGDEPTGEDFADLIETLDPSQILPGHEIIGMPKRSAIVFDGAVSVTDDEESDVTMIRVLGDITTLQIPWRGEWATDVVYYVDDCLYVNGSTYICIQEHLSYRSSTPGHPN